MRRFLCIALLALPLAACDETAGLDDPINVVVDDAIAARESGDVAAAEQILRRAFERDSTDAKVRVELATTLLQRDDLNLLDLDRIGQFLSDGAGQSSAASARGACAAATAPGSEEFDPTAVDGFAEILSHAATIAEAGLLLEFVVPDPIQGFDICSSVQGRTLVYDRDAAIASLESQGLNRKQVAQALAVNALVRFLDAYLTVATELPANATWYRLADGSVTICVDDEDALQAAAEVSVRDLGEAVLSLDARASIVGSESVAAEIVDIALDAYEGVRDAVADFCD